MEAEKINLFISTKGDYFPSDAIPMMRERLEHMNPDYELAVTSVSYLNPMLSLGISIGQGFIGLPGIDRIMIGQTWLGIGKFALTWLGCGTGLIWWIADWFLIVPATKQRNLEKFIQALGG